VIFRSLTLMETAVTSTLHVEASMAPHSSTNKGDVYGRIRKAIRKRSRFRMLLLAI
jgi:hypothetical protein